MFRRLTRRNTQNSSGNQSTLLSGSQQLQGPSPRNVPDWIVHHALNSKLSVVEVERLWNRFQQLGADERGHVPANILQEHPFNTDPFLRQVWKTIPRGEDESVSFEAFLGIMKWWQDQDKENKLRAIFKTLNNDKSLDEQSLQQVLLRMDNNMLEEEAINTAEMIISHLDEKHQGFIDEDSWVEWTMRMSPSTTKRLLSFCIIPQDLPPLGSLVNVSSGTPVTGEQLIIVAAGIGEGNWTNLAINLGLSEEDISSTQEKFRGRSREQAYQMLLVWKRKKKTNATVDDLSHALDESGLSTLKGDLMQQTSAASLG